MTVVLGQGRIEATNRSSELPEPTPQDQVSRALAASRRFANSCAALGEMYAFGLRASAAINSLQSVRDHMADLRQMIADREAREAKEVQTVY